MEFIVCPGCGKRVQPDQGHRCPHCHAFLHPDPIKRKEAEMAAFFRSWVAEPPPGAEEVQPSDATLYGKAGVSLPNAFLIDARAPPNIETEFFVSLPEAPRSGVVHSVPSQPAQPHDLHVREELWRERQVQDFVWRVNETQETRLEQIGPTKLVGKPLGRGVVLLAASAAADDGELRRALDAIVSKLEDQVSGRVPFKHFVAWVGRHLSSSVTAMGDAERMRTPSTPMIHNVLLVSRDGRRAFHRQYWPVEVTSEILQAFVNTLNQLQREIGLTVDIPIHVGGMKFLYTDVGPHLLLVSGADPGADDAPIRERLSKARALLFKNYSREIDAYIAKPDPGFQGFDKFRQDLDRIVDTMLKICLLGQGGVGKSTMLKLLTSPSIPDLHLPRVVPDIGKLEGIRFGPYELVVWDFHSQDKFRSLWRYYLRNADAVLLVTDSTLKNVLETRDILEIVRKDAPSTIVWAIANKQDLPGALAPSLVQRILGVQTYGLVATDPRYREELFNGLAAAPLQRIPPPLEPPEGILREPDYELRNGQWRDRRKRNEDAVSRSSREPHPRNASSDQTEKTEAEEG